MVDDDVHRDLRADFGGVAPGLLHPVAHGRHVEQHDEAEDVLAEHAGRVEGDAHAGLAGQQRLDLRRRIRAVDRRLPHEVFQQHAQGER